VLPGEGLQQVLDASERYRDIFNAAADAMTLRDEHFRVVDVNPAFVGQTGFTREEALGKNFVLGGTAEADETILARHRRALAGEPTVAETTRMRKDGVLLDVELRCIPIQHQGRPHVLYVARDISEQKRAAEALRASEEQYRSIFNAAQDAMVLRDAEFRMVEVNAAWSAVTGISREEAIGLDRVLGDDPPEFERLLREQHRKALAGERSAFEASRTRRDGRKIDLELHALPVQYRRQPHVLFIGRDISERKRAEEALRASEEQHRSIFNASQDTMVLRDAEFRVVDVNAAYEVVTGCSREETIGQDHVLGADPPEFERMLRSQHHKVLTGETMVLETERIRRDGRRDWRELRAVPVRHQGKPHVLYVGRDIGARRRVEEALRASEEQYRAIFNASADAIVLRDAEFRIVDVNPAYETMSGYRRDEVIGVDRVIANPPEMNEPIKALHKRALAGETVSLETRSASRDGRPSDFELRGFPMQYRGRPHVLWIGRDISARKRTEEALRSSEEQYRAIFNACADALVLRDARARIVDVNRALVEISGYSREEVLNQDRFLFVVPEDVALATAMHRRAIAGESVRFEARCVRKDGTRFDAEIYFVPMPYRGEPHALSMARNITARKRAEDALRSSEEQYRAVFNATTDALVLRDAEQQVVDVNPAFLAMSGFTREEVISQKRWFFAGPEMETLAKQMHARVIAGETVRFEVYGYRKDGTRLDVEMHAVPMPYRGRPHALGMARDITARKRADAERAQLEGQLRQAQKMEAIGHLAGGIAHDFNNILTSIQGYAQLVGERPAAAADAKLASHLDHLELACNRARELIQQMLIFSRGRRGAARPVALAPLVRQAIRLLRSSLPATLEIVPEFAAGLPAALLDPVQAEQVLMNLCINARDAMHGRGIVQVGVACRELQGLVCASCRGAVSGRFVDLSVADAGPGIPPEVMERMFEPFFSTKETGRGTGMGLAIVHGIVHEHGGHILVDSSPAGARFQVLFPAVFGQEVPETPPKRRTMPSAQLSGRVLLVDDEHMVARFMHELLQGWGLQVTALTSAVEARQAFTRGPQDYDLLLTDYTMPRMTGLDLARALRAIRPALPVILYSGYTDVIPESELGDAAVELVQKPIDPDALLAALRKHL